MAAPRSDHRSVRAAVRLFAALHSLLPRWYRRRHGRAAVSLFAALAEEARRERGVAGLLRVLVASAVDLLRRAPGQHGAGLPTPVGGPGGRSRSSMLADGVSAVRLAVRGLARQPVHSIAVVLTLALATGATTAIASVADAVLFRPLPYADPGDLYRMANTYSGERVGAQVSYPDWVDVRNGTGVFSASAMFASWSATLTGQGDPVIEPGVLVSAGFFGTLGLQPALGRGFLPEEDIDGRDDVVVLGYGLWQRVFDGDPSVIGRSITLEGRPHVIVGVGPASLPDYLPGIGEAHIYRPLGFEQSASAPSRGNESYSVVVRLAEGVSHERADAAIGAVMADIERDFPDSNAGQSMRVEAFREDTVADARPAMFVFVGAVIVLLLIAVVNVVNLMLARAADRRGDLAMRSVLGAGRTRIAGQLIGEALILALAGGALGWWVAVLGSRLLVTAGSASIPLVRTVTMDARILVFTAAVCAITGIVTGLVVATRSTAGSPGRVLIEAGNGGRSTGGRRGSRLRQSLVTAQVALCVVLVIGAALLGRSLDRLTRVDPGFDTRVVSFRLLPTQGTYPDDPSLVAYYDAILEGVRAIPGVQAAATVGATPLSGRSVCGTLYAEEDPHRFDGQDMCAEVRPVSPDYFDVMGIPLAAGRSFGPADDSVAPLVGLVSETTAALLWPDQDPIGRKFTTGLRVLHEVVGVVRDVKQHSLSESTPPQTYLPDRQWVVRGRTIVLRSALALEALYPALRTAVWSVDDQIPIRDMGQLEDDVSRTIAAPRFRTLLVSSFALLALILAVIGLYGVIAGSVTSRRGEMAIRLSLGARPPAVLGLILREGGRMAIAGIGVGILAALALTRVLNSLLFGVTATDPFVFVASPLLVGVVALVANFVPAVRATRVDPAEALRGN